MYIKAIFGHNFVFFKKRFLIKFFFLLFLQFIFLNLIFMLYTINPGSTVIKQEARFPNVRQKSKKNKPRPIRFYRTKN